MTVPTAFRLDEELFNKLKKHCKDEGRSQIWVVNKSLSEYFEARNDLDPKATNRKTTIIR
jgi:predicted transcriptional regulator